MTWSITPRVSVKLIDHISGALPSACGLTLKRQDARVNDVEDAEIRGWERGCLENGFAQKIGSQSICREGGGRGKLGGMWKRVRAWKSS